MLQPDIETNQWVRRVLQDDRRTLRPDDHGLPLGLEWCPVPGGAVELTDDDLGDGPGPSALVTPFEITRLPVTNAQFDRFVAAGGYDEERYWTVHGWRHRRAAGWDGPGVGDPDDERPADEPVTAVSWWEAMAFACWADALLPTEAQWEAAARMSGPAGRDAVDLRRSAPPASPFGHLDMNGRVAEWCLDNDGAWPAGAALLVDPVLATSETAPHAARGGCGLHDASALCGNSRDHYAPGWRDHLIGFRLVRPQTTVPPPSTTSPR